MRALAGRAAFYKNLYFWCAARLHFCQIRCIVNPRELSRRHLQLFGQVVFFNPVLALEPFEKF